MNRIASLDSTKITKKNENDKVYMFLEGLNQMLDEVRSRLLERSPLPTLGEAFVEMRNEKG